MPMSSPVWEPVLQNITPETTPWWLGVTVAIASGKDMELMKTKKETWSFYILFWVVLSWYFCILYSLLYLLDFTRSSVSKEFTCNAGGCLQHSGLGFNPWVRKIRGEGNGNPLQYSCLGDLMDRGARQAVLRVCQGLTVPSSGHRHAVVAGWFLLR